MRCCKCNGTIQGTKYRCTGCKDFVLCSHCMASGQHNGHNVIKYSGKSSQQSGSTAEPHPCNALNLASASHSSLRYSPIASASNLEPTFISPETSPGINRQTLRTDITAGQQFKPAPSLPYGIIPAAPKIFGPATFPKKILRRDLRHETSSVISRQISKTDIKTGQQFKPAPSLPYGIIPAAPDIVASATFPRITVRRDLRHAESDLSVNWAPIQPGVSYKRLLLKESESEYHTVLQNMLKEEGDQWTNKVISIHRIENHKLYKLYRIRQEDMQRDNDPDIQNERILYHGTSAEVLSNIYRDGFNRSYCGKNATAYGEGVYFARHFSYSASTRYSPPDKNGHKYVFQCRVLTGHFTEGEQRFKEPPLRNSEFRFDSVVDNLKDPKIFVVFKDMQVYPEYLLTLNA